MSTNDAVYYRYTNLSASALLNSGITKLGGIHCNSTSSGTVKIYDNTAASGTVVLNTYTLASGWNPMPFILGTGCFITIGGTADITVAWL